jgi:hypothetical protein
MPEVSVNYDIRVALQTLLKAESFPPPDPTKKALDPENILVRVMPKVSERLDKIPCMILAPYGTIPWYDLGFEYGVVRTYTVELAIIAEANYDFATDDEGYNGWLEQATRSASPKYLEDVPSVWGITVVQGAPWNRGKIGTLYAYMSALIAFESEESRN